jgi:hypothetical protein
LHRSLQNASLKALLAKLLCVQRLRSHLASKALKIQWHSSIRDALGVSALRRHPCIFDACEWERRALPRHFSARSAMSTFGVPSLMRIENATAIPNKMAKENKVQKVQCCHYTFGIFKSKRLFLLSYCSISYAKLIKAEGKNVFSGILQGCIKDTMMPLYLR